MTENKSSMGRPQKKQLTKEQTQHHIFLASKNRDNQKKKNVVKGKKEKENKNDFRSIAHRVCYVVLHFVCR